MLNLQKFKTLVDLLTYFNSEQVCRDYLELIRWEGAFHTNTLEGYWSLVKRGCIGIYHSWSAKHLQMYLNEFSFRYNTRKLSESERFNTMLSNIAMTLPYKKLIENGTTRPIFRDTDSNNGLEIKQGNLGF